MKGFVVAGMAGLKLIALAICMVLTRGEEYGSGCSAPSPTSFESATASLNAISSESSNVKVSLIDNGGLNFIEEGAFFCNNDNQDSFCVSLNVCNNKCNGIETISIDVYGGETSDVEFAVDLISAMPAAIVIDNGYGMMRTGYLSLVSDWDGELEVPVSGVITKGGVFAAPRCDSDSLIMTESNEDDFIDNFFAYDDAITSVANGDLDNYQLISDIDYRVGETSPVTIEIVVDRVENRIISSFAVSEDEIKYECAYNTVPDFESSGDYQIYFGSTLGNLKFDQFDVTVTCEPNSD